MNAYSPLNDQRIETLIGTLLRIGVILSAAVVFVGAMVYLAHHSHDVPSYAAFHGEPERLKSVREILQGAMALRPGAIIQLGLLLLIATPIARVVFSAVAFAIERDYLYVVITLVVLGILMYSLLGSV